VATELFAAGLRNPWRFSFDAPSGLLYIGDVGQDAHEEVNVVPARTGGQNFGWPFTEGLACYSPSTNCTAGQTFTFPALTYPHSEGCAVTGGYVYRGSAMPELVGHYVYTDYCSGWLRSFLYANSRATEQRSWSGINIPSTSSFGQDGAGELYVIGGAQVQKLVRGLP
jgi:glucose/arabinose dehydrogenase